MGEETIYEAETTRSRRGIATDLRRIAKRLDRGGRVPVDDEQTVAFDAPDEAELEVELEREDGAVSFEIEMAWEEDEGAVHNETTESKATFELYEDSGGQYRWRLRHDNGNIIADGGEGYTSKRKAEQGLESVKRNAPGAHVVDQTRDEPSATGTGGSKATFEVFRDAEDKWRWRLRHDNGEIIADSGEGYASKQKVEQGLESVKTNAPGAPVEEA